jgi:trehalose-phosphatase
LPAGLLARRAARAPLLLCLDYDGTLAEFAPDPARAVPVASVRESLLRLAAPERIALAIVTGRRISDVRALIGIDAGVAYAGIHGLEFADDNGVVHTEPSALAAVAQLDQVRKWLSTNVPPNRGFWIEDKRCAVGLHYRLAEPSDAMALCRRFREFLAGHAPDLRLLRLNMIDEVMPGGATKALAVAGLMRRFPHPYYPIYFGDDVTDEDAFRELGARGLGILVGPERPSSARYRVDGSVQVAEELRALAAEVSDGAQLTSRT